MLLYIILTALAISMYSLLVNTLEKDKSAEKGKQEVEKAYSLVAQQLDAAQKDVIRLLNLHITRDSLISLLEETAENKTRISYLIWFHNEPFFWHNNQRSLASAKQEINSNSIRFKKFKDGYSFYLKNRSGKFTYMISYKVKNHYAHLNRYLTREFLGPFRALTFLRIYEKPTSGKTFSLLDPSGKTLFYYGFSSKGIQKTGALYSLLLLILYVFSIIFFSSFLRQIYLKHYRRLHLKSGFMLILFSVDVLLIRALLFYFKFPESLYTSILFDPRYFASSNILPSLGDLLINTILILYLSYSFNRFYKINPNIRFKSSLRKNFAVFTLFLHLFIFLGIISIQSQSLLTNSSINLNLNNLYNTNIYTFLGYLILSLFILAYFLVSGKILEICQKYGFKNRQLFQVLGAAFAFYLVFKYILNNDPLYWLVLLTTTIFISLSILFIRAKLTSFYINVMRIVLFSIFITVILDIRFDIKEKEQRKFLASNLLLKSNDPTAEYFFTRIKEKMLHDKEIKSWNNDYVLNKAVDEDSLRNIIIQRYFQGFWKKFDLQITICRATDYLDIESINTRINCFDFFGHLKEEYGDPSSFSDQLYRIEYANGESGYLGIVRYRPEFMGKQEAVHFFLEFMPLHEIKELGYPDLLIDDEIEQTHIPPYYSWAMYEGKVLKYRNGSYAFRDQPDRKVLTRENTFFKEEGYSHYFTSQDNKSIYIVREIPSGLELLTPFPYIFVLLLLANYLLQLNSQSFRKPRASLLQKLQLVLLGIFIIAYFLIAQSVLSLLIKLDKEKNIETLNEKTHSILIEMQHKLANYEKIKLVDRDLLDQILTKFSNVFFTDINIFALDGQLIASSRSEIFDQGLSSDLMNYTAYQALSLEKKSLFIHTEYIGNQEYYSSYIPFVNENYETIAYLNLPYFARQTDLQKEVSSVVATFVNLYVLITIIIIVSIVLLSRLITRPVQLLIDKIKTIQLGRHNEKIEWKSSDEFSYLIAEYNRMIDELEVSAEKLAVSERENAWRDVARQIAHEIKNPLTPMKLSAQQLMRSWNDKDPEFEARLNRFMTTITEEIDTLSGIASEFSRFATLPKPEFDNIDLLQVARTAKSLFETEEVQIDLEFDPTDNFTIVADKRLLNQVLNNLIKNAVQSIVRKENAYILIDLERRLEDILVSIRDNGKGIEKTVQQRIFEPKFTTKSSGMGLGLAMVRTIIELHHGKIWFESKPGKGTTFYFTIPLRTLSETF